MHALSLLKPVALAALLALGACASSPPPLAPPVSPAAFKEAALWQRSDAKPAAELGDAWWTLFQDPVLDRLQRQLVIGNENLKAALAQVDAARALLGSSRAAQLPSLNAGASATRGTGSAPGSSPQTVSAVSVSAAWELDLWGRLSKATQASEARLQASEADLAALRLSTQATLAQAYFSLRAAEAQQAVIERSITAYQRSLDLTRVRLDAGVAAPSDVLQAQTQLKTAQVQGLESANQRALYEHAIAVLLGQAPSALTLEPTASLPEVPSVPPLLPATLLQRRPDIAAAERRVKAAQAQIGVAETAWFPSLTLGASAGYRSSAGFADLIRAPNLVWSLGPALAQRLFDGGATKAAVDQARANAEQAGAAYRQAVLLALQEVEDNLVLSDRLQAQSALQLEALAHAQRNLEITQEQYRVGTVSYLNVVTAQTTALSSERTLLDLRARELNAVNQLLKNVAGKW